MGGFVIFVIFIISSVKMALFYENGVVNTICRGNVVD